MIHTYCELVCFCTMEFIGSASAGNACPIIHHTFTGRETGFFGELDSSQNIRTSPIRLVTKSQTKECHHSYQCPSRKVALCVSVGHFLTPQTGTYVPENLTEGGVDAE